MFAVQLTLLLVIAITLIVGYFLIKRKNININKKAYIIASSILAVAFFFRFMLGNEPVRSLYKLVAIRINESFQIERILFESKFLNAVTIIAYWLQYASVLALILYPFFKRDKYTIIIKYFCLPVAILNTLLFYPLTMGAVSNAYDGFNIQTIIMAVELAMSLGIAFVVFMENNRFKCKKSDLRALYYIAGMMLSTFPPYLLKAFFGDINYAVEINGFSLPHRMILYLSIIIPIAVFISLKNKDQQTKKLCLLYICLGTLLSFSMYYKFKDFTNPLDWPLHLCNTAMYILPICIIFNLKKVFYFTYFINVFGAFVAMIVPDFDLTSNVFNERIVEFFTNHYIAFFMPLLLVSLGVFKRPKLKEFRYSMIGFAMYFILVLVVNSWFSNFGEVDYFYINSDFIADKLGLRSLLKFTWTFTLFGLNFKFYPLYQAIYFVCYGCLAAGMWFIYESMYSAIEVVNEIIVRKKKIKADMLAIQVATAGRGLEEPMNKNGANKIILRNFSKRYSTSSVYAVKDANLEINGGQIFGFLGHNGAGKSTIIKSIVGILPVTEGEIEVCGYDVVKQSTMAKKHIGFVPDHYALYEKLTGREYINYIADLYGVSKSEREKVINKYIELFELKEAFDSQIKTYSHGMKQKITIISALVHNPKVWILDEPLTGLDPTSIFQVKECMREHAKKGNIVFFSSHLIDIVESLCDKIAVIKKGKILVVRDVAEIEKECSLEQYYLDVTSTNVQAVKYIEKETKKEETLTDEIKKIKEAKKSKRESKKAH